MNSIRRWSAGGAIAVFSLGCVVGSAAIAEADRDHESTIQGELSDSASNLSAEPVFITGDAVLRVAPDPRATITHQIVAGTPVRVTHQSDRYFYIEVIEIKHLEIHPDIDTDLVQGWISDCHLYGQCQ